MSLIPMQHGLLLAGILFALGLAGLLVRRNLIFTLMSIEVMLNAAGLAFVVAGSRWAQPDGQVMSIEQVQRICLESARHSVDGLTDPSRRQ